MFRRDAASGDSTARGIIHAIAASATVWAMWYWFAVSHDRRWRMFSVVLSREPSMSIAKLDAPTQPTITMGTCADLSEDMALQYELRDDGKKALMDERGGGESAEGAKAAELCRRGGGREWDEERES